MSTELLESQNVNELEKLKLIIEKMDKIHHIEILKILKNSASIKLNENKNGVFINLTFLSKATIDEIQKYLNYVYAQENSIRHLESQCETFKKEFFTENVEDNYVSRSIH